MDEEVQKEGEGDGAGDTRYADTDLYACDVRDGEGANADVNTEKAIFAHSGKRRRRSKEETDDDGEGASQLSS